MIRRLLRRLAAMDARLQNREFAVDDDPVELGHRLAAVKARPAFRDLEARIEAGEALAP